MGEDVVLAELSRAQFGATMAGYMLGKVGLFARIMEGYLI